MKPNMFDKELELRSIADGAETATASEAGVALPVRLGGEYKAVFHVTDLDTTTGDETYALSVEVDSQADFLDAPVSLGSIVVTAPGVYELPLSGPFVAQEDVDAAAIRVTATLAGTTPVDHLRRISDA